jgi:tetratricopeptide (TPR) repeat protein
MKKIVVWSLMILMIACSQIQKPSVKKGEINPEAIELNKKGFESMNRGAIDSALYLFNQAIEADSNYDLPYSNKASVYIMMRQYNKALRESELTNLKNPENAEGWNTTGMLSDRLKDSVKAVKSYQKCLEVLDKNMSEQKDKEKISQIRLRKALIYILLQDEEKATETINLILAENPDNPMIKNFTKIKKKTFMEQMLP